MTLSSGFERRLALPGESLVQGGQGAGGHGRHQALHLEGGPGGKVTKTKMHKKLKRPRRWHNRNRPILTLFRPSFEELSPRLWLVLEEASK